MTKGRHVAGSVRFRRHRFRCGRPYVTVSIDSHVGLVGQRPAAPVLRREVPRRVRPLRQTEMESQGLLSWRSSEANSGGKQSWSLGKSQAERGKGSSRRRCRPLGAGPRPRRWTTPKPRSSGSRPVSATPTRSVRGSCNAATSTVWRPDCRTMMPGSPTWIEQGVAADVIFHGGLNGQSIPFSTTGLISWGIPPTTISSGSGSESTTDGWPTSCHWRRNGTPDIAHIPISDLSACPQEIEWAAEAGLKGINLPAPRGDFPMLNDPAWEPIWAACNETRNVGEHARRRRGALPVRGPGCADDVHDGDTVPDPPGSLGDDLQRGVRALPESQAGAHRAMGGLGAGARWPTWMGFTTVPTGAAIRAKLPKPPSEYFRQNCFYRCKFHVQRRGEAGRRARPRRQRDAGRRLSARRRNLAGHPRGQCGSPSPMSILDAHSAVPRRDRLRAVQLGSRQVDEGARTGSVRRPTSRCPRRTRFPKTPASASTHSGPGRESSSDPNQSRSQEPDSPVGGDDCPPWTTPLASKLPCRLVTAEEVAHLHEHGWVKLKRFVDPRRARQDARARPREDG